MHLTVIAMILVPDISCTSCNCCTWNIFEWIGTFLL